MSARFLRTMSAALVMSSCAVNDPKLRTFANNDLQLAVANAAKMECTCKFVMQMPDDFCQAWVKASPDVARYSYDATTKTVEASAFISWSAHAHFIDDKRGCVLE
jgi:hypothetical protein